MAKIISLRPEKDDPYTKAVRARDSEGLFDINTDDITRQPVVQPDGAVLDYVVYGPQAEMQVRRCLAAFGIDELPLTYYALKGTLLYCNMLNGLLLGMPRTHKAHAEIRTAGLNVIRQYFPKDYEAAVAFLDNDIARLREIHKANNIVAEQAEYYERVGIPWEQRRQAKQSPDEPGDSSNLA